MLRNAFNHLTGRSQPLDISIASFVVMLVTVGINLAVVAYESREATRLGSEVLLADAMQTRGDVWTSLTVIAALIGARFGVPILDPLAALVVAGFIGYAGYQIARATTGILSDRIVISDADLERVVMSVPGVLGCHHIRTRGAADHVFLDLHVWLPPDMRLTEAHAAVSRRQGPADGPLSADCGRGHPHRAAAVEILKLQIADCRLQID